MFFENNSVFISPYGAEVGIFQNSVNVMAANDLAPYVTRSSVAMILIMQD